MTSQILSQDEVDALLQGIYGDSNGKYAPKVDQLIASSTSSRIGEPHA